MVTWVSLHGHCREDRKWVSDCRDCLFHLDCQNGLDLGQLQQSSTAKIGGFDSLVIKLNNWKQGEPALYSWGSFPGHS